MGETEEVKAVEDTLGKVAFVAYCESVQHKDYAGNDIPKWESIPSPIQEAWEVAARAVHKSIADGLDGAIGNAMLEANMKYDYLSNPGGDKKEFSMDKIRAMAVVKTKLDEAYLWSARAQGKV